MRRTAEARAWTVSSRLLGELMGWHLQRHPAWRVFAVPSRRIAEDVVEVSVLFAEGGGALWPS